jgi:peroxiredoxin
LDFYSHSQQTKIFGNIPGGDLHEVRIISYTDQVTYLREILDRTVINEGGSFELTISIHNTISVSLEIENYAVNLFIDPGETYQLICDSIFPGKDYLPFYNQQPLRVRNISEPEPAINSLISYFDYLYDDFVLNNFEKIYRSHKKSIIDKFEFKTDSLFSGFRNEFLQVYIDYKIASLKYSVSTFTKDEVFSTYIAGRTVYYDNPEYMNFFHQYFDHYIAGYNNRFVSRDDLITTINEQYSYTAMLDSLGKDSLLRNEVIRELVLVKTLQEVFHKQDFSKANIVDMLKQMKEKTKFEQHRLIAENTIHQLSRFEQGIPAPDFRLPNLDEDTISLTDYAGKPVYLSFMTTWSYACLGEFALLNDLYKQYENQIHFVTISLDKNPEVVKRFISEKEYYWDFLYNGSAYDLILDYDVKTFPSFILIDRKGKIFDYAAFKPSEIIENSFKKVLRK